MLHRLAEAKVGGEREGGHEVGRADPRIQLEVGRTGAQRVAPLQYPHPQRRPDERRPGPVHQPAGARSTLKARCGRSFRGLKAAVDSIARDQALGVERRAAMQRSADSIYARLEIVGVRLTQAAYAHGLALALPEKVEVARPTGLEPATFGSGTQRSIH